RAFGGPRREHCIFNPLQDDRKSPMVMGLFRFHFHVRGEDCPALHFFGGNSPIFEAQFAEASFDGAEVCTGVNEGAQDHIATDAGKTVEICYPYAFHELLPVNRRTRTRRVDTSPASGACQISQEAWPQSGGDAGAKIEDRSLKFVSIRNSREVGSGGGGDGGYDASRASMEPSWQLSLVAKQYVTIK